MKKYNFAIVKKTSLHSSLFVKFRGSKVGKKIAWIEHYTISGDKVVYIYPLVFQRWLVADTTFNKKDEYFLSEVTNLCFSYFDFFLDPSIKLPRRKAL